MERADESYFERSQQIKESTTWYYTTTITDELGVPLPSTQVTSLTATWYDRDVSPFTPVPDWDNRDVKNTGGGTLATTGGKFELRIPDTANSILHPARHREVRRLLLTWVYASGTKTKRWEVDAIVKNLHRVP